MKKFWNKQLPAALLALIMMVSLVPLAGAADCTSPDGQHTWSEWTVETPAACLVQGTEKRTCSACGASENRPIAALGHDFTGASDTTKEPSCTEEGRIEIHCTRCDQTTIRTIPALGHKMEWSINKEATCQAPGVETGKCSVCGASDTRSIPQKEHTWDAGVITTPPTCTAAGVKTYTCSTCRTTRIEDVKAKGHTVNPSTGKCTVCGAQVSLAYTVTFQTPRNGTTSQQILANGSPTSLPTVTSSYSENNMTYTFVGWTPTATSTPYIYTNQTPLYTSANQIRVTGPATYYAVYRTNGYTVTFQTLTTYGGSSTSTQTVMANGYPMNPSTPSNITIGSTTYTFKGWTTSYAGSSWYLYTNQPLVTPAFQRINANTTFYAVYSTNGNATISYNVDPGKKTSFDSRDFYNAYRNQYNGVLNYVTFSVNRSTYENFSGTVYAGNSALTYSNLTSSRFYYNRGDAGWNDYALDDLSLQAGTNARDESITLNFTAYGSWGNLSGTVKLTVGNAVNNQTIVYKVTPGKTVSFDRADFDTVFRTQYPGETVGYVVFDYPSSTAFSYGTLYSNYGSSSYQTKFTRSDLGNATFYYNGGYAVGRNAYAINDLTFVAESVFKDTVTLTFTAYALNNTSRKVTGKVEIRSSESTADSITYKVAPGRVVTVSRTDFLNFLRKTYSNETLDYVSFDRPDTNAFDYGTLYGNYNTANQIAFSRSDLASYSFYYEASRATSRYSCPLDNLTFVADSRFTTPVKLSFTAYDDDTDYVRGTLVFQPDGTVAVSNYVGSVRYSVTAGTSVQINANDIARYFNKATGGTLQYVTLTGVPSTGSLYYNYYGASKYGSSARMQLTAANASVQPLYLNPASTAQYALTELTYVPSGSNYCVSIPFTAYGSNYGSTTGTILISVSRSAVPEVYGVTSRNTAVNFPASGIYSAVLNGTGSSLYSIQLLSLPASSVGTVYVGSGTSVKANTTTQYTYASGTNSISQLRFVPTATYTGSVEIPYVALNSNGVAIASGLFSLGVVNSRKSFSDVGTSTWCYKYVTELSDAGVIDGYANGAFKPDSTISYGAALKLIMLAAGYPELAPTNKNNVFSGYLTRAQADGLVTRSNVNLSAPITRLQVAQLAAAALKLNTSNLSSVKPFTDTSDLYVQALNAAGIVEGYFSNGTSTFKPNNTLTRGQVSAIVWRMQNYRK